MAKQTYYDYLSGFEKLMIVEDIDAWCPAIKCVFCKDVDKRSILLKFVLTQNVTIHVEDISKKPVLPFAV